MLGDSIYANVMILGASWQNGMIPLSKSAIHKAITLNGTNIEMNIKAFELGCWVIVDPSVVEKTISHKKPYASISLSEKIDLHCDHIELYQNKKLADKIENNKPLLKEDMQNWHDILNKKGWLASSWPKEYNGTGWGVVEQFIFEDELAAANAPRTVPFGLRMLAPVLMKFGTKDQCNYWLPRILDGSDWWCQGYSEPGSGSDLASLKTSAVKCGDQYLVNGQKTWTTLAQHANMIFNLVRTSNEGKPQQGISFLMIDMNSPGIEVRPIKTIDGGHEVNEVWFSDVRVPAENLIGEENKGWTYAKYLLSHERNNLSLIHI